VVYPVGAVVPLEYPMPIVLQPSLDPNVRAIAQHLYEFLNQTDAGTIVQSVYDFDWIAFAQPVDFPVLQVFRLGSTGHFLEISDLAIEYYLPSVEGYSENPGALRLVEVAIAQALESFFHHGQSPCLRIKHSTLRSERGYLKLEDAGINFPYARLTVQIQEVDQRIETD
jgi:hypothetical protein